MTVSAGGTAPPGAAAPPSAAAASRPANTRRETNRNRLRTGRAVIELFIFPLPSLCRLPQPASPGLDVAWTNRSNHNLHPISRVVSRLQNVCVGLSDRKAWVQALWPCELRICSRTPLACLLAASVEAWTSPATP